MSFLIFAKQRARFYSICFAKIGVAGGNYFEIQRLLNISISNFEIFRASFFVLFTKQSVISIEVI